MKHISKTFTTVAASSCLLFGTAGIAANPVKDPLVFGGLASHSKINMLFAMKLKQAKLVYMKDQEYKLSFKPSNIVDGVLAFSDRPNRVAFRMSYTKHVKLVTIGRDSFIQDKPNLVLSWAGIKQPPTAFKVVTASHSSNSSQYTLQVLRTSKKDKAPIATGTFKDVQLFIDNQGTTTYSSDTSDETTDGKTYYTVEFFNNLAKDTDQWFNDAGNSIASAVLGFFGL
jgi:hypothetical protein